MIFLNDTFKERLFLSVPDKLHYLNTQKASDFVGWPEVFITIHNIFWKNPFQTES